MLQKKDMNLARCFPSLSNPLSPEINDGEVGGRKLNLPASTRQRPITMFNLESTPV